MAKPSTGFWAAVLGGTSANAAFANGSMEFRSGAAPADADQALTGTVLGSPSLGATPFSLSGRTLTMSGTWQDAAADAAGTIGYAVMKASGEGDGASTVLKRMIFTVGTSGSGAEIIVNTTTVTGVTDTITFTAGAAITFALS